MLETRGAGGARLLVAVVALAATFSVGTAGDGGPDAGGARTEFSMPAGLEGYACDANSKEYCVLHHRPVEEGVSVVASVAVGEYTPAHRAALESHAAYCRRQNYVCVVLERELTGNLPYEGGRQHEHMGWQKYPLVTRLLEAGVKVVMTMDLDAIVMDDTVSIQGLLDAAIAGAVGEKSGGADGRAEVMEVMVSVEYDAGEDQNARPTTVDELAMVVSGDTNAANNAQIIYLNRPFTLAFLEDVWRFPDGLLPIFDNGAFSAALCGCTSADGNDRLMECYNQCDRGWTDRAAEVVIKGGGPDLLEVLRIPPNIRRNVAWLPQRSLNSSPERSLRARLCPGDPALEHYPKGLTGYRAGDFVVHTAGCSKACRDQIILHYAPPSENEAEGNEMMEGTDDEGGDVTRSKVV